MKWLLNVNQSFVLKSPIGFSTGMGVVVQEMVASEAAGVLFTVNPVDGNPARMIITANFGLGESVGAATQLRRPRPSGRTPARIQAAHRRHGRNWSHHSYVFLFLYYITEVGEGRKARKTNEYIKDGVEKDTTNKFGMSLIMESHDRKQSRYLILPEMAYLLGILN